MSVIASPCVSVCQIDRKSGYCLGCWRTIEEIAGWARFDDERRRAVIAALPARRSAGDPPVARLSRRAAREGGSAV